MFVAQRNGIAMNVRNGLGVEGEGGRTFLFLLLLIGGLVEK